MHWIVQNNIYSEEGHEKLIAAIERYGSPYTLHKCVPFVGTLDPEPAPTQNKVIVMGSYTLARVAQMRGWKPGVFLNDNFNAKVWTENWPWIWNWDNIIEPIRDIGFKAVTKRPFFIRPILDSKSFSGQVMDWGQFSEWRDNLSQLTPEDLAYVDLDTEVLIAPAKPTYREYRVWMVYGRAVTASQYKLGRTKVISPNVDERVFKFAEEMDKIWSPCAAYVMDVFEGENGGLAVGEINNLNSAGFYAGDMAKLVGALEEAFDHRP